MGSDVANCPTSASNKKKKTCNRMKHISCISIIFFLLLTALMMLVSCKDRFPKFITTQEEDTIQISATDFQKIDASGYADITFIQSDTYSIEASGNKDLLKYMHVKVSDHTLVIQFDNVIHVNNKYVKLRIQAPALEDLDISGSCKFSLDILNTQDFLLDVSGAAECRLNNLTCNKLGAEIDGAAQCEAVIYAKEATLDLSGAAQSQLDIAAERIGTDISGAHIATIHFEGTGCSAEASGAAELTLDLQCDDVVAEASGAANVVLSGKCPSRSLDTSGAASIHTERLNK